MSSLIFPIREMVASSLGYALVCIRLFSFSIVFFAILLISYQLPSVIPRYDFISIALFFIYGAFFVLGWRNRADLLIHAIVHLFGLIFEIYKVNQQSWVYPEEAVLMIWSVPFYSGFMYTSLVDFFSQFLRFTRLKITTQVRWWLVFGICVVIYLNFFTFHLIDFDIRYLLVIMSLIVLVTTPVTMQIKKSTIQLNMLVLMLGFALMLWAAENIATFYGAWLYISQTERWVPVSPHKFVSWFLLGQFFLFIVVFFKRPDYARQPTNRFNKHKELSL